MYFKMYFCCADGHIHSPGIIAVFEHDSSKNDPCGRKGGVCETVADCDIGTNIYKDGLCTSTSVTRVCCIPRESVCVSVRGTCTSDVDTCLASGKFYSWFHCDLTAGTYCCLPRKRKPIRVFPAPHSGTQGSNQHGAQANTGYGENKGSKRDYPTRSASQVKVRGYPESHAMTGGYSGNVYGGNNMKSLYQGGEGYNGQSMRSEYVAGRGSHGNGHSSSTMRNEYDRSNKVSSYGTSPAGGGYGSQQLAGGYTSIARRAGNDRYNRGVSHGQMDKGYGMGSIKESYEQGNGGRGHGGEDLVERYDADVRGTGYGGAMRGDNTMKGVDRYGISGTRGDYGAADPMKGYGENSVLQGYGSGSPGTSYYGSTPVEGYVMMTAASGMNVYGGNSAGQSYPSTNSYASYPDRSATYGNKEGGGHMGYIISGQGASYGQINTNNGHGSNKMYFTSSTAKDYGVSSDSPTYGKNDNADNLYTAYTNRDEYRTQITHGDAGKHDSFTDTNDDAYGNNRGNGYGENSGNYEKNNEYMSNDQRGYTSQSYSYDGSNMFGYGKGDIGGQNHARGYTVSVQVPYSSTK